MEFIKQPIEYMFHIVQSLKILLFEKIELFQHHNESTLVGLLKQQLGLQRHLSQDIVTFLVVKLDQVFPAVARSKAMGLLLDWLPLVIGLVCCLAVYKIVKGALYLCGGGTGKMMKAPGRKGVLMPRANFEADARGYFTGLRAGRSAANPRSDGFMKCAGLVGIGVLSFSVLMKFMGNK